MRDNCVIPDILGPELYQRGDEAGSGSESLEVTELLSSTIKIQLLSFLRSDQGGSRVTCSRWVLRAWLARSPTPASYTYQEAVAVQLEPERLVKILEVLQELPAPNYRCVRFPACTPGGWALLSLPPLPPSSPVSLPTAVLVCSSQFPSPAGVFPV